MKKIISLIRLRLKVKGKVSDAEYQFLKSWIKLTHDKEFKKIKRNIKKQQSKE